MKKHSQLKISLIAVGVGFLFAFLIVILAGRNPLNLLAAIIKSVSGFNILRPNEPVTLVNTLNWLKYAVPITLTGLSVGFAYRTGLFNIGGEGQILAGGTAAAAVALMVDLPPIIHPIVCLMAGALAGALWGFVPGILKAVRGINEVVICIMMNYVGLYATSWFTRAFLPIDLATNARTIDFPDSAVLGKVFEGIPSLFNWGFLVAIVGIIAFWFIMEKTTFGYSLRATGFNKEGARFAGMKVERNIALSMMISGAFCGLAGAVLILGEFGYGRIQTSFDNFGFDGISVALVGGSNAIGIMLSGLLFGLLKSASSNLQMMNIPKEVSELAQAVIIYLIAIQYAVILVLDKFNAKKKKKNQQIEETVKGGDQV